MGDLLLPDPEAKGCVVSGCEFEFDRCDPEPDISGRYPQKPVRIGRVVGMSDIQGYRIYSPRGHAITISAQGGGAFPCTGGYRVNGVVRTLHPRECARIMGFPDSFVLPSSRAACRLLGNSVVVPVVRAILSKVGEACQLEG